MEYINLKALHLVFMVTWFAGLFYIVRLFIYHREAQEKAPPENDILTAQFSIMERRLWYAITWPSAILCTIFGFSMLYLNPAFLQQGFMHVKLGFIALLWVYQVYTHVVFRRFQRNEPFGSSMRLRFLNEVPTVILISVIFVIVQRNAIDWVKWLAGILGLAIALTIAIKLYQEARRG